MPTVNEENIKAFVKANPKVSTILVAEKFKVSSKVVYNIIRNMGREDGSKTPLTRKLHESIAVDLSEEKLSITEIAEKHNVSNSTVSRIKNKQHRFDVEKQLGTEKTEASRTISLQAIQEELSSIDEQIEGYKAQIDALETTKIALQNILNR